MRWARTARRTASVRVGSGEPGESEAFRGLKVGEFGEASQSYLGETPFNRGVMLRVAQLDGPRLILFGGGGGVGGAPQQGRKVDPLTQNSYNKALTSWFRLRADSNLFLSSLNWIPSPVFHV